MKVIRVGAISIAAGLFYITHYDRISLQNQLFRQSIAFIHEKKPEYTLPILKLLINYNFLDRDQKLGKYVMGSQFDLSGQYLEGLLDLGFKGVQIGPISFLSTGKEQDIQSLGMLYTLSQAYTFLERRKNRAFEINIDLHPNFEILKYTPYQMKENVIAAVKDILNTQTNSSISVIHSITLNFNGTNYKQIIGESSPEMQQMIIQTIDETNKLISQIKQAKNSKRMKLNLSLNSQQLNVVKYCKSHRKGINKIVLDGQTYEIHQKQIVKKSFLKKQTIYEVDLQHVPNNILKWQDLIEYILKKKDL